MLCVVIAHFEKGAGPLLGGTTLTALVGSSFCIVYIYLVCSVQQAQGGIEPDFRDTSPPRLAYPPKLCTRYTATAGAGSKASDVVPLIDKSAPTRP